MDSQPITSSEKPEIRTQGSRRTAPQSDSPTAPSSKPDSSSSSDTVSVSPTGREKLEVSQKPAPSAESADEAFDRSRKFTITEDNDVVVKILDTQTQEVVKQIPSEEELKLKEGIRTVVEDLSGNNSPDLNI